MYQKLNINISLSLYLSNICYIVLDDIILNVENYNLLGDLSVQKQ